MFKGGGLMVFSIVLFICIFVVMYSVFVSPSGDLSIAETTVDVVRSKLIEYLERGEHRKIIETMKLDTGAMLKKGFIIGVLIGILLLLLTIHAMGSLSLSMFFVGMILGILAVDMSIRRSYREWRQNMAMGIPSLIDFLPAFLEIKGMTVFSALKSTLSFIPEPLKSEIGYTVTRIGNTGDYAGALNRLSARINDPVLGAVCARLSATWESEVSPDLFLDLSQDIEGIRELIAAKATVIQKVVFVVVSIVGLIGLIFLAGYPAMIYLEKVVGKSFGG